MKKIINKVLFVTLLLSSSLLFSQQYNIKFNNEMVGFNQAQDYYIMIKEYNKEQKVAFLEYLNAQPNFNSLSENKDSPLYEKLNDDFIDVILNKDGYIQIGSYIYKIDPINQLTAVIKAADFNEEIRNKMNLGDYSNSLIRSYSIDDDVIKMVESNIAPSNAKLFCGESGAGGRSESKHVSLKNPKDQSDCNWMDCWVKYIHAGIYFALSAKCENRCPSRSMYYHKTPVGYKVKCGYSYGPVYQWDNPSGGVGSAAWNWHEYYYQNVQPLNAYWLRIVFMAKDATWIGNPDNPSADLEIRINM